GFAEFNTVSTSFRHIEWWLTTFKSAYNVLKGIFSPNLEQKAVKWMERREEQIADILNEASEVVVLMKDPKNQRSTEAIQRYFAILERMKILATICLKVAPSTRFSSQCFRMFSELLRINVRVPTNTDLTRMEPVGIWISSEPGQGKSFLTHMLTTRLLKSCDLQGIYTNPTGSEFMDGYVGQDVHIIDDAGQNREEKDLALLCQCISSVPFTVPMADLAEKGTFYTSKIVVATTNKMDFSTMVLTDSEALARRFPFNFRLRAKVPYCKNNRLNVPDAMAQMADGSCWEISRDQGRTWNSLCMDTLVKEITDFFKARQDALMVWQRKLNQVRNE
nr:2C protein [parechovirus C1]